jgi:hypothetical protein
MSDRSTIRSPLAAIAVTVLTALGVGACTPDPGSSEAERPARVASDDTAVLERLPDPVGPTGTGNGVPLGWAHDTAGAEAAAVAFVESSGLVATAGPLTRRDVILVMATARYGPVLVEATNRQLDDLLFELGERGLTPAELVWNEYALTVTSTPHDPDRVEVRVWSVLVMGTDGGSVARQVWRTSILSLDWVDGDWKVDQWNTEPGPLPAPPPEAAASSVAGIAEVTSWRSVSSGAAS